MSMSPFSLAHQSGYRLLSTTMLNAAPQNDHRTGISLCLLLVHTEDRLFGYALARFYTPRSS